MTTTVTLLKNAMNEAKVNQKILQQETGIDQHTLSDYINDKKSPRIEELVKISKALSCNLEHLIDHKILYISNNIYNEQSSSVQNNYTFDKSFVIDIIKENLNLKNEIVELKKNLQ